ncbi:MAG: TrkA family potassium uptake protein [Caulobacter sp.]|nr:TrkA family potassium uptake protein [Caulobacter sp.]
MSHTAIRRSAPSLARSNKQLSNNVVVVGLGRFGGAVAQSLSLLGHEVLAIEEDLALVQSWSDRLTHVVQADASNIDALRRLGVADFQHAVVGIGNDVESSVLTVLALSEIGVPDIWAKAISSNHGKILEKTGAHHVVYPEVAMGERVAHLVTGKMIDFIEFDDDFAIVKTRPPREALGKTLGESQIRTRHGVTVVGVKRPHEDFTYAKPGTLVADGDLLIISGPTQQVERFAALL